MDVSIVIPTFNRVSKIFDAVDSCMGNNDISIEIIIVDDGSEDDTKTQLLNNYSDWSSQISNDGFILRQNNRSIRYLFQNNSGAPSARNNGLKHSTGEFVKFLDSDDLLIKSALKKEIQYAREMNEAVVLTGWIIRELDVNGNITSETERPAPNISRGIDDMLDGKGPWTSAALYRRAEISSIKWDESIEKAQEWMWAWEVCLAGISFSSLNISSAYYIQYQSSNRITQQGDSLLRSTRWRLKILYNVEKILRERGLLNETRARQLIQYYYKDARVLCNSDVYQWIELHKRMLMLDPKYMPEEKQNIIRIFNKLFGLKKGIIYFVALRKVLKRCWK